MFFFGRNKKLCDVQISIGDEKISAHKNILASHSKYFYNLFTNDLSESKKFVINTIDVTPKSFEVLIDFIYSSKLTINSSNVKVII